MCCGARVSAQRRGYADERVAAQSRCSCRSGMPLRSSRWTPRYPGLMPVELDCGKGRPSRWNTLRALRVMDWASARGRRECRFRLGPRSGSQLGLWPASDRDRLRRAPSPATGLHGNSQQRAHSESLVEAHRDLAGGGFERAAAPCGAPPIIQTRSRDQPAMMSDCQWA